MSHDPAYRLLFSKPRMVEDLLRGFVPQPWVKQLDFSSLEKLNTYFVAKTLRWRDSDLLWRVRFQDDWLYVLLLIEFQSSIDRYMALRLWVYLGLLYQDLLDQKQLTQNKKLPPVMPMVLYNGESTWTAPTQLADLLETLPGLGAYQPQFRYFILDEGRLSEQAQQLPGNLVAALFQLESSREPADIIKLLTTLIDWLQTSQDIDTDLNEAFLAWLKPMLVRTHFPEQQLNAIDDLYEVKTMLAERMQAWTQEWKQEGLEQGLEQGLSIVRRTLKKQLVQRFGELPAEIEQTIDQADQTQLEHWLSQVIVASSLTVLFKAPTNIPAR